MNVHLEPHFTWMCQQESVRSSLGDHRVRIEPQCGVKNLLEVIDGLHDVGLNAYLLSLNVVNVRVREEVSKLC